MATTDQQTVPQVSPLRTPRPSGLPGRADFLAEMLASTKRPGVPIRSIFVQVPATAADPVSGYRGSSLAKIVKTRSAPTLDAYLLIHALASSREPYEAWYPVASWARALGLDVSTGSGTDGMDAAKTQWSKLVRRLVDLQLIRRRRASNRVGYQLLDEAGTQEEYVRPTDHKEHGHWFALPYAYWRDDHYRTMDLATKVMLLISLSSKDRFVLPAGRVATWYGVSEATARRGLKALREQGILEYDQTWRADPNSKTGWTEVRTYYLLGEWSIASRKAAMTAPRTSPPVVFGTEDSPGQEDVTESNDMN